MAKKDRIQKEIERFERYARFYQNLLLAILSGIVWSIYAVLENKANNDIIVLAGIGLVVALIISLKIKVIDNYQDELLRELEKED
jgi:threonine/homoserine efflux transporter RhtA